MKKLSVKTITWYGIALLFVLLALLPLIQAYVPLPEGFRDVDCQGKVCGEGEFCQDNTCIKRNTRGAVPDGNE